MKKFILVSLSLFTFFLFTGISNAGFKPFNIGDITDFMDSKYFNAYVEETSYDFSGEWKYTGIGYESGHINYIKESESGTKTFTTASPGNFGNYNTVNFDSANLYFSDGYPANVPVDDFQKSEGYFRIFRLTQASNPLSYLSSNPIFEIGTFIIGFNDNGFPASGDSDFDDIIAAASPKMHAPEPATILLLGAGLLGLAGWRRKKLKR